MNCQNVTPLLSAYVDNELSGGQQLAIREHLRHCASCEREAARLADTREQLASMAPVTVPADLEARLKETVFARRPRVSSNWAVAGLVATASMAAAVLAIKLSEPRPVPTQPLAQADAHRIDALSNQVYATGADPLSGGVPVVTVGYAGDR